MLAAFNTLNRGRHNASSNKGCVKRCEHLAHRGRGRQRSRSGGFRPVKRYEHLTGATNQYGSKDKEADYGE